jgi:hypothetical protein
MKRKPTTADRDNPFWTAADFAKAKRPEEVLPPEVLKQFPKQKLSREEQIAFAKALADPLAPNAKLLAAEIGREIHQSS